MQNPKRQKLRMRFSLKTLLVLPVLVGAFFALHQLSDRYGRHHVQAWLAENEPEGFGRVQYEFPLVFSEGYLDIGLNPNTTETYKTYYLWLLGPTFELWDATYIDQIDKNNSLNDIAKRRLLEHNWLDSYINFVDTRNRP